MQPPLDRRLGAGLSYLLLSIAGTIANILVAIALYNNKKLFKYPFYTLAAHIVVADFGVLLGQFIVAVPLSLSGQPLYGDGAFLIILSSLDTLCFLTLFFIGLVIAIQRVCALFFPSIHQFIFEKYLLYTSVVPWLLGVVWVINTTAFDCPKIFTHETFFYRYRCSWTLTGYPHVFMKTTQHLGYLVPAITLILYVLIMVYIRRKQGRLENEWNMLIQATLICVAFEVESLLFMFLPHLTPDWGLYWVSLIQNWTLILDASVNPMILLLLNPVIRSSVSRLFRHRRVNPSEMNMSNARIFEVFSEVKPPT